MSLDVNVADDLCCIIGENNTGKTAILRAIQICLNTLLLSFRSLLRRVEGLWWAYDQAAVLSAAGRSPL